MSDRLAHYVKLLDFYRETGEIDEPTYANAKRWLTGPEYEEFRDGVIDLLRPTPLIDSFYQLIPFGTGGRRGTVGVGANRMNARTVGESAQGVAAYIKAQDRDGSLARGGVVIAHDVRLSSEEFTRITTEVFAAAGIKVFLFDGPRSTPLLSFAVRELGATAGVVVTASHNPPSDNGFKAYWSDGGQVVPPHDAAILEYVKQVDEIHRLDIRQAKERGLVEVLDDRLDILYRKTMLADLTYCVERDATLVFSPLHGTGVTIVPPLLKAFGFTDLHMPAEQLELDGRFPTVPNNYPNPEQPAAMGVAVTLGKKVAADLVMASDPDADRLGIFVPDGTGEFVYLTGNEFQALMLDFVLARRKEQGRLGAQAYVCTTLVTTKLLRRVAEAHGVEILDDLLVGFKNIALEILNRTDRGIAPENMVFACEESIGYMLNHRVRDKDSASAAATAGQMTAFYKARGKSLLDRLHDLYAEHGYFANPSFSVFLRGEAGAAQMAALMDNLRENPPSEIGGQPVVAIIDRGGDTRFDPATGEKTVLGLGKSNVLVYELGQPGGENSVAIRPSGTEPKIKHYISCVGAFADRAQVDAAAAELEQAVRELEKARLESF
jgi:phosphoglucomutase